MSAVVAMLEHCQNSCWAREGAWPDGAVRGAEAVEALAALGPEATDADGAADELRAAAFDAVPAGTVPTGAFAAGVVVVIAGVAVAVADVAGVAAGELVVGAAEGLADCGATWPHSGDANIPKLRQRLNSATVRFIPVGQAAAQKFPLHSPDIKKTGWQDRSPARCSRRLTRRVGFSRLRSPTLRRRSRPLRSPATRRPRP